MTTRRAFVTVMSAAFTAPLAARRAMGQGQGIKAQSVPELPHGADALTDPTRVGRASSPLDALDNDPGVIAIERKLRCSCGCTLDVYTCRTTDFACTYSPAMHKQVLSQVKQGATAEEVVRWFVSQPEFGEKVLMAPPAQGFNLAGYLMPGVAVASVGIALIVFLSRRREHVAAAAAAPVVPPPLDEAARQRLQRALDDVEG